MALLKHGYFSLEITVERKDKDETRYRFTPRMDPRLDGRSVFPEESFIGIDLNYDGASLLPDMLSAALTDDKMRHWEHSWLPGDGDGAEIVVYPHRWFPLLDVPRADCFTLIFTTAVPQYDVIPPKRSHGSPACVLTPTEQEFRRFVAEFAAECAAECKNCAEEG